MWVILARIADDWGVFVQVVELQCEDVWSSVSGRSWIAEVVNGMIRADRNCGLRQRLWASAKVVGAVGRRNVRMLM